MSALATPFGGGGGGGGCLDGSELARREVALLELPEPCLN